MSLTTTLPSNSYLDRRAASLDMARQRGTSDTSKVALPVSAYVTAASSRLLSHAFRNRHSLLLWLAFMTQRLDVRADRLLVLAFAKWHVTSPRPTECTTDRTRQAHTRTPAPLVRKCRSGTAVQATSQRGHHIDAQTSRQRVRHASARQPLRRYQPCCQYRFEGWRREQCHGNCDCRDKE